MRSEFGGSLNPKQGHFVRFHVGVMLIGMRHSFTGANAVCADKGPRYGAQLSTILVMGSLPKGTANYFGDAQNRSWTITMFRYCKNIIREAGCTPYPKHTFERSSHSSLNPQVFIECVAQIFELLYHSLNHISSSAPFPPPMR